MQQQRLEVYTTFFVDSMSVFHMLLHKLADCLSLDFGLSFVLILMFVGAAATNRNN